MADRDDGGSSTRRWSVVLQLTGEGSNSTYKHCHRVGVVTEPTDKITDVLMHHCVIFNSVAESCEFAFRRKLSVKQQIANFKVAAFLSQLVDRVAAMQQNTFITIDECDRAFAAAGTTVAGIVGEESGVFV